MGIFLQVSRVQQQVHGHVKYHIQHNHAEPVGDSQLGRLFYQGHHQDGEGYEHTTDNIQVCEIIKFALGHASSDGISGQRVDNKSQDYSNHCDQ